MRHTFIVIALFALLIAATANAQPVTDASKPADSFLGLPELADDQSNNNATRASGMECFVDTPAFDQFTLGFCGNVGLARTTSAVFRLVNRPANFTALWSDPRCSTSSDICILPISFFQQLTLSATVLNNSNNTFTTVSATALYEGFF